MTQTLSKEQWELLLIDNASRDTLARKWDLSWHPHAHHFRENELGLTFARLRGIRESTGKLLVFVDDDNLLAPDYIEIASGIADECQFIGAFGGQIVGDFEEPVPAWLRKYLHFLVIRPVERDTWSNLIDGNRTLPVGAGLCVRRSVADIYAQSVVTDPLRQSLDRRGCRLVSGGDIDLALTACDLGFGTGMFAALNLSHLIPANRMTEQYLVSLVENIVYSKLLVKHIRGRDGGLKRLTWRHRLFQLCQILSHSGIHRRLLLATGRGEARAREIIQQMRSPKKRGNGNSEP